MIRTKILDMADLEGIDFMTIHEMYNRCFGKSWPEVPCRMWEYIAAIVYSEILSSPGRVCDAGCGHNSAFTRFLAMKGNHVDALDISLGGNKQVFAGGGYIQYHNLSMTDIRLEEEKYDYVFAMSSIEHINAGEKFAISDMDFDTGDTLAMLELASLVKPGGILIITTDFADKYYPPPGLWKSGAHRIYDWKAIMSRLVLPVQQEYGMKIYDEIGFLGNETFWKQIKYVEPISMDYTEMILTLQKRGTAG